MTLTLRRLAGAAAMLTMAAPGVALAQTELRFTCYGDGNECEVMRELLDRFEAENPDITVALDKVPYKAILESLPVQLAAGEGPDLARVTDLGGLSQYYLDLTPYVDAAYWEENFGDTLDWYRAGPDDQGIYGMMTQLTITGPYINTTLFEQAGVAVPARRCRLGDLGRGRAPGRRGDRHDLPDGARPLRPPPRRPGDLHGRQVLRRRRQARPWSTRASAGWSRCSSTGTRTARWPRTSGRGQGGAAYQDAAQEFINGQPRLLLLRQLAGRALRGGDRRRLRLAGGGRALRPGRLHRHAGRRRPRRLQGDRSTPRRSPR